MAKSVLFQAALLLIFIAGGHSQSPGTPTVTPKPLQTCVAAIASCRNDTGCARLYAAFEGSCRQERDSMRANCSSQCMGAVHSLVFLGYPLGLATLLCDCGSASLAAAACRTSQMNLQANCLPAPPPGMLQSCHATLGCSVH